MIRKNIIDDDLIFYQLPKLPPRKSLRKTNNNPDQQNNINDGLPLVLNTISDKSKKLIMKIRNKFLPAFLFSFIILVIVGFIVGRKFAEIFAISLIIAIFFASFVSLLAVNQ